MKFTEYAKNYIPKINEAIESMFNRKLNSVDNSFLKDYYSELKDYFLSGGKRIRPLLGIATFNAFSESLDDKIILPSVGVEFLHNASLIHDDIIDKDNFRRGKPSFHYRFRNYHKQYQLKKMIDIEFGNSIGIIGGDSAFIMGLEEITTSGKIGPGEWFVMVDDELIAFGPDFDDVVSKAKKKFPNEELLAKPVPEVC